MLGKRFLSSKGRACCSKTIHREETSFCNICISYYWRSLLGLGWSFCSCQRKLSACFAGWKFGA